MCNVDVRSRFFGLLGDGMKIQIFDYRDQILGVQSRPFPSEINESPWVLFHGTTNVSESRIESHGFEWVEMPYTRKDVESVINIFRTMDWAGKGTDTYLALQQYALSIDFERGSKKPVFFSERAEATVGYTRPHRAGGETANCILLSLRCLEKFLSDEGLRIEYRKARYRRLLNMIGGVTLPDQFRGIQPEKATANDCKALAKYLDDLVGRRIAFPALSVGSPDPWRYDPWDENLDWLANRLEMLAPLKLRLEAIEASYSYGLIYAVQFESPDVAQIKNFDSGLKHGIAFYGNVPISRIIGKAYLSARQNHLDSFPKSEDDLPRLRDGILGTMLSDEERERKIREKEKWLGLR